ncbi:AraC family transcriptional regulator [Paenibacillaceae bacterium]|nr:AraC family transcriptional regulator [Paenibacillaceae bacterium]
MIYLTHLPHSVRVKPYIQLLWYIAQDENEAAAASPRMIPDGLYHLVINLGDAHSYLDREGRLVCSKRTHVNAHQSDYVDIARSGRVEMMGVMFRPLGFAALLKNPVHEITGGVRNMDELLGAQVLELEERLMDAESISAKFLTLEGWLIDMLQPEPTFRPEAEAAAALLIGHHGLVPVRQVAEQVQMTERTLERAFKAGLGVTPKQFADIRRMQFVLQQMELRDERMLHYVLQAGFYDQAHFIHRFKRMVGMTPSDYFRKRNLLSDLYNTRASTAVTLEENP